MYSLVRKTLEIYLREKRVITLSEFPADVLKHSDTKESVFVTLYKEGRVIASSGRISCLKKTTILECIDNTLLCLKDPRFSQEIQDISHLEKIQIRVDRFPKENRRILRNVAELDTSREGLILLSQNLGVISVILPHMVHVDTTPDQYFRLACKKAKIENPEKLTPADYVLYGLTTINESDFG